MGENIKHGCQPPGCQKELSRHATTHGSPRSSEHDETKEHDEGVLDETELASDPVTLESNKDLTDD